MKRTDWMARRRIGAFHAPETGTDREGMPMVTVGMYYDVIPGKDALFRAKFQDVLALLKTIPGHARSFLYQRVDEPDSYAILSEWEDREAFLDFLRSDIFRQVTSWGREQVLRAAPRHTIYARAEDLGRPS